MSAIELTDQLYQSQQSRGTIETESDYDRKKKIAENNEEKKEEGRNRRVCGFGQHQEGKKTIKAAEKTRTVTTRKRCHIVVAKSYLPSIPEEDETHYTSSAGPSSESMSPKHPPRVRHSAGSDGFKAFSSRFRRRGRLFSGRFFLLVSWGNRKRSIIDHDHPPLTNKKVICNSPKINNEGSVFGQMQFLPTHLLDFYLLFCIFSP